MRKLVQPDARGFLPRTPPAQAPKPAAAAKPAPAPVVDDGYKEDARDGDGDGLVQDGTKHERPVGTKRKAKAQPKE